LEHRQILIGLRAAAVVPGEIQKAGHNADDEASHSASHADADDGTNRYHSGLDMDLNLKAQ
jgi:hypothetical protein